MRVPGSRPHKPTKTGKKYRHKPGYVAAKRIVFFQRGYKDPMPNSEFRRLLEGYDFMDGMRVSKSAEIMGKSSLEVLVYNELRKGVQLADDISRPGTAPLSITLRKKHIQIPRRLQHVVNETRVPAEDQNI